jgi:hypothetical protein
MGRPKIFGLTPVIIKATLLEGIPMLDAISKLPTKPVVDQSNPVQAAPSPAKSATKAGAIVLLSPTSLKLTRDLQAIQADPEKAPEARLEAQDKLRQLALQVFSVD